MIKNYLKIAWRNLVKDRVFTSINIVGLSIAFGVAILLAMAGFFDLSYDKFHVNAGQIYKVYSIDQTPKGPDASVSHPAPLMAALTAEVPGIKKASRYLQDETIVSYGEKEINMDAVWVDTEFFNMFTFPAVQGKRDNMLNELSSIVITQNTAKKLFGTDEAVGKTVQILINGEDESFTVQSVVENNVPQSSLEFELAVRFEKHEDYQENQNAWNAKYHDVYVQMTEGVSPAQFEKATRSLIDINFKEQVENAERDGAMPNSCLLYTSDAADEYQRV